MTRTDTIPRPRNHGNRVARLRRQSSGEPFVWLSGGALILGVFMVVALLLLVVSEGAITFWPRAVEVIATGEPRYFLHHETRGRAFLDGLDRLIFKTEAGLVNASGEKSVPASTTVLRPAGINEFRSNPGLFEGQAWRLADAKEVLLTDAKGNYVSPQEFIKNPKGFPSRYAVPLADGKWQPIEDLLSDDTLRDVILVMGSLRQERDMDLRDLPRKADGTPWTAFELEKTPTETLLRMGNKVDELGGDPMYFRWLKSDVPDVAAFRRGNPTSHAAYVLRRDRVAGAVEIERLEKGFLCGFVVSLQDSGKPQAERTLVSFEKDGPESVWKMFQSLHAQTREAYLKRVDIEKEDIGDVNAQMEEYKRLLLRERFDNRHSGIVVTALNKLEEAYASWSRNEPKVDVHARTEDHEKAAAEWRKLLDEILEAWRTDLESLMPSASEIERLEEIATSQRLRADLQAGPYSRLRREVTRLQAREAAVTYTLRTLDGRTASLPLAQVVRAYKPNDDGLFAQLGVYFDRVREYLLDNPREANTEGGIFPVIAGTLIMTMLMSIVVVPFGVIAALYLREYARQGTLVSLVRIAVNNLAGVPSVVFGIFGLGFFCVVVGGSVDSLLYPELLPTPTFGGGGVLWAALTLALLTVPVVIVATEEALIAVPSSQREASLGAGASRWQTIQRVILPQAMPGILTGLILAMARGAGEVAPLMLVGAVKLAPDLPIDGDAPFVHLERKFMHLGFHIFDVGFQSPDVDNTKPLVFTTTLVLLVLVAVLNLFAIRIRNKIRKRLKSSHV